MKAPHFAWMPLCGALLANPAGALDVADPTRPPYAATVPHAAGSQGGATGAASGAKAAASDANTSAARAPGSGDAASGRTAAAPRNARLSAILMVDAPGRHAAVIDGQVRHVGDRLDGGTIAHITSDGVSILLNKRTVRLNLYDRDPEPLAGLGTAAKAPTPSVSPPSGSVDPAKEQP